MKRSKFSKSDDEEDEGEANWQDSYSDLMTDLLAIFVVLFSFAMMSQAIATAKQKSDVSVEASVIERTIPSDNRILDGQDSILSDQDSDNSLVESIDNYIEEANLSEQLSVEDQGNNLIMLRVASSLLFDSGRADIHPNAEPMLGKISEILIEYADSIKMVRIEGHTDNVPMSNMKFDSNWELSTSRAVNVLRWILDTSQLEPEKFSAVGYSEFHPIAENDTATNRATNRRVDFFIEKVSD